MNNKYSYAEGGFLDDGAEVDPISGNEVPSGSLAEEVRDDVPAQLSEGEFVVPADVVRYIGLEKLMQMRDQAKSGLAQMEQEGQMGGSPAPAPEMQMQPDMSGGMEDIDIDSMIDGMEDSSVQSFDVGGFVKRDDGSWQYAGPDEADGFEGTNYADLMGSNFGTVPTTDTMTYVNADGHKIYIPVIDGKPAYAAPEGYTLVASEDVTDDPTTDPEAQLDAAYRPSSVNSGPSGDAAATQAYRNDGGQDGYQADVNRSERMRSDRANTIESLASPNMTEAEMDVMYAALTPQAKMIYDTRFRDEANRGFLDGFMSDGKSPTDLLITAQKTADSINRAKGETEPGSGFMPDGEPIDWAKAMKYVAAGFAMGPAGLIGVAGKNFTDEELEDIKSNLTAVGKVLGSIGDDSPFKDNTVQPNKPVNDPYTKLNQAYWQTFTGDVAAEKRRLEDLTGLNAYGHKVYKEPGTRTVWDNIAEVEANKQNTIDLQALRATEAQDAKNLAEVRANRAAAVKKAKADKAVKAAEDKKTRESWQLQNAAIQKAAADKAAADKAASDLAIRNQQLATQGPAGTGGGGGNSDKGDNSPYKASPYSGYSKPNDNEGGRPTQSSSPSTNTSSGNGTSKYFKAEGGFIKKMRNDPTAGLAAKKKSKQKAQAKKGALAAKRT